MSVTFERPKQEKLFKRFDKTTKRLIERKLTISTMESCTGGMIASLITDTEGASAVLKGAFVTYSNEAKIKQGVRQCVIEQFGVYSNKTAVEMAKACRNAYNTNIGIGITGTFKNTDPNNADSTPGTVYIAIMFDNELVYSLKVSILTPNLSRQKYKFVVAEYVASLLEKYLRL